MKKNISQPQARNGRCLTLIGGSLVVLLGIMFAVWRTPGTLSFLSFDNMEKETLRVNPANFACDQKSPVSPAQVSDTNPTVALTHIFCGQIKVIDGTKKAEGFHSRPENKSPQCARIGSSDPPDNNQNYRKQNVYCVKKVEVLDASDLSKLTWIPRTNKPKYCFFPTDWSVLETVNKLIEMYNSCNANLIQSSTQLCISNYKYENGNPFEVVIFHDKNGHIISAFPTGLSTNPNAQQSCHKC